MLAKKLLNVTQLRHTTIVIIGGTIADVIQDNKKHSNTDWPIMSETDSLGFLEDVLKAVKFLHSKGIVHRDIKGIVMIVFFLFFNPYRVSRNLSAQAGTRFLYDITFSCFLYRRKRTIGRKSPAREANRLWISRECQGRLRTLFYHQT